MPPTTPEDERYAAGIDHYCVGLGYKRVYELLERAYREHAEATLRQNFRQDGALANELVEIVRQYPEWTIRFKPETSSGYEAEIRNAIDPTRRDQAEEILQRIRAAFDKHNKVPGVISYDKHVQAEIQGGAIEPEDQAPR